MKVKNFLGRMLMQSDIEFVEVYKDDYLIKTYDEYDLLFNEYGPVGEFRFEMFSVRGRTIRLYVKH